MKVLPKRFCLNVSREFVHGLGACLQGERVTLVLGLPWYLSSGLEAISQVGPLPYHPGQLFTSSVEQMCFAMHDILFNIQDLK